MTAENQGIKRYYWLLTKPVFLPLLVFIALFLIGIDLRPEMFFWKPVCDSAHFGLFLVASGYAAMLARAGKLGTVSRTQILIAAALATVIIEIIQPLTGRSASFVDIRNGLLGVLAGGLIEIFIFHRNKLAIIGSLVAATALQLLLLYPAYQALSAINWRAASLPLIADFESPEEFWLWEPISKNLLLSEILQQSEKQAHSGKHSLQVQTTGQDWSGVKYYAGFADWSHYQRLELAVYNENKEPQTILFRIDDDGKVTNYANRFNAHRQLEPGWNLITFSLEEIKQGPKKRQLNINKIYRLLIFADKDSPASNFYLDSVRLH